jgi:hypothetical protein
MKGQLRFALIGTQLMDRAHSSHDERIKPRHHLIGLLAGLLLVLTARLTAATETTGAGHFVQAEGSGLTRAGVTFRAVGFNQPDLFSSVLINADEDRAKSFAAIDVKTQFPEISTTMAQPCRERWAAVLASGRALTPEP